MLTAIQENTFGVTNSVKFRINKEKLYTNTDGFTWKDNSEFEFNGMLYDIIKTEVEGDYAILYCLNDITEQEIVKSFNDEVNALAGGKLNNSTYKTSLLNIISQALCINPFEIKQPDDKQQYLSNNTARIIPLPADIPTPPPKTT